MAGFSTLVLSVDPTHPESTAMQDALARAAAILRAGGLVAFPTETVYGLGAVALDPDAVARIYQAKGRPSTNPLIVHVADVVQVLELVRAWPAQAQTLADRFWPGPLTLVLPRTPGVVPDVVTGGRETVAVRIPAHPVALELLRTVHLPLAAASANRSMELSPTCAEHVLRALQGRIELILDGGPTTGGLESTVLDLTTSPPHLLRPGLVDLAELQEVVGEILFHPSPAPTSTKPLPSPGMLPRHYAPRTPMECVATSARERVLEWVNAGKHVGWLTFTEEEQELPAGVRVVQLPTDPVTCARMLYAVLHELDAARLDQLVVELPAGTSDWLAIRDRLSRACTKES